MSYMKQIYFILSFIFIFTVNVLYACEVCGCSAGGTSMGILPQFRKNFIGFHYFQRDFETKHFVLGQNTENKSFERFQTLELRGRFYLSNRIQLFAFLPFNLNQQIDNSKTTHFYGLGDASVIVNYHIMSPQDSTCKIFIHNLQLGGGLKLPTGTSNALDHNLIVNPYIQTGTGSWDVLLDAIYTLRYDNMGWNSNVVYRLNTSNSNQFRFGNRTSINTMFFYWAKIRTYSLLPNLGLSYEYAAFDCDDSTVLWTSGGHGLFSTAGLDFYTQNMSFGMSLYLPVYQSNNNIQNRQRINLNIVYNF